MVDSSCPSCENTTAQYKKGGKVRKSKKSPGVSHSVLCERCSKRALNPTVLLRKGNAPRRSNPGVAKRFLSPGSAFGGGLPRPLQGNSYASAPSVATPMGRMDFIGSGESSYYYNRGRDRRDDFQVIANPSDIKPDPSPSMRAVKNTKAVESPDSGMALSRNGDRTAEILKKAQSEMGAIVDRNADLIARNLAFLGKTPVNQVADMTPAGRAVASQPSTGFMNTKSSLIGAGPASASAYSSAWDEMSPYKSGPESYAPPSLTGISSAGISSASQPGRPRLTSPPKRRPASETQRYKEEELYGPAKGKREAPENYQSLSRGGSVF